ncbi:MAG: hypothetical protein NZM33_14665 [Bryobacteraceae bacterium]|nr:hypothetical protein [Bryobacteraceae bacterium]
MTRKAAVLMAVVAGVACGATGGATGKASNEVLVIEATAYCDRASIKRVIGAEVPENIVVLAVRLAPKGDKPLLVSRDDFVLRSDKDGQRSQPFAPSQIAGSGVLVISQRGGGGAILSEEQGPIIGGWPGGGRPRRLGGEGTTFGNVGEASPQATLHSSSTDKKSPLLALLEEKVLPEKEASEPLWGLLYFPLEGKHKPKQLELLYNGPAGKLSIRFQQ